MSKFLIGIAIALGMLLIVPCVLGAWTKPPSYPSIKPWPHGAENIGPHRPLVDEWRWSFLNKWYGNSEDGVSGQQAWIWENGRLVPYMPNASAWRRAFAWSAWRNNANNLKRPLRSDSLNAPIS